MSLPKSLALQTVTLVRAGEPAGEDAYGNPTAGSVERVHLSGCSLQPLRGQASTETLSPSNDRIVSHWMLYLEPGVDVRPDDRIQQARDRVSPVLADADAYLDLQVDGDAGEWAVTGTALNHIEVALKRWEG